jgi:hypothetical protein
VVELVEGGVDEWADQRVVGTTQQENGGVRSLGECFEEVDAEDFGSDRVVCPILFDERDEEGAGLFGSTESEGIQGAGISAGLGGGGGSENEDVISF